MGIKGHVRDELVNQQSLIGVDTVSDQRDEVPVVHAADDLELRPELAVALPALRLELLDRHLGAAQQPPPVHAAETALPDDVVGGEPLRRGGELLVRVRAAGRQFGDDVDGTGV